MASRHTEHYGLSQWEASDKVERTDFNADNAAVDGALHALAQSKAETAALSQLSGLVAQKADQTALEALEGRLDSKADQEGLSGVERRLSAVEGSMPRTAFGSYTGNGTSGPESPVSLAFSFPPQLLAVRRSGSSADRSGLLLLRGVTQGGGLGHIDFPQGFTGKLADLGLQLNRTAKSGIRAAVIREKGCQCERETAWALHLAGFDVKDVHMTDLISGHETLEEVNMIVFVGGFSNSDVLGSAKGWAGAFKFNEKARQALENFYKREDTLSLGICNGCQLAVELGLIYPEHAEMPKMLHNDSHKFESGFVNVTIQPNHSVMLKSLAGSRLGIWIAHGEGKFSLPYAESEYHIPIKYSYDAYPGNPNGSPFATAAICSKDGRHLAMMPHLERSIYPWNWAYYAEGRSEDEVSPWIEAFVNARKWIEEKVKA